MRYGAQLNRSKYGSKKVTHDGIEFDSKVERDYYLILKDRDERDEIGSFRVQPRYLLQEKFVKHGQTFLAIEYIADFEITHLDGSIEVVDIKGMETEVFRIKRKLFEHKFPELKLSRIKWVKKYGGYIAIDEYNKRKRKEKADQKKLGLAPRKRSVNT